VIVLLFGAPGSGKGTQSKFISECRRIPTISTGDMLRTGCRAETTEGLRTRSILANGSLVNDDLVNAMVVERVAAADCRSGFILDGYPRTAPQAAFLAGLLEASGFPEPTVIHLDVPIPVLVARLSSRRHCPSCGRTYNLNQPPAKPGRCDGDGEALIQRADDAEDVVGRRLEAYHEFSSPLIEFYQGPNYHRIDGQRTPARISAQIQSIITPRAAKRTNGPSSSRVAVLSRVPSAKKS
jgi:adenylate kinase